METVNQQEITEIAKFGKYLISKAGRLLLKSSRPKLSFPKGDFDLVTNVDTELEKLLISEIKDCFPHHDLIAEESGLADFKLSSDFCWVIDPLDGTVNLAANIPIFSISLALLYRNNPVLAWVYDPLRQELFHAQKGSGAFLNGQQLKIGDTNSMLPIGGSSGFIEQSAVNVSDSVLTEFIRQFGKIRILGSQALHLSYLAAGRFRAAISWEARIWDDVAGALIAQESGALYTDFQGSEVFPLTSNSSIFSGQPIHSLAAVPSLHQDMVDFTSQWMKD